jgi:FKBP-type peptidyl-prolyl cis-trans isomerase SlyD
LLLLSFYNNTNTKQMIIQKNCVVTVDYTLTDSEGIVIDSSLSHEPMVYLHGTGSLLPGMEHSLEGKAAGDKFKISLTPENAFGLRDEALVHRVPMDELVHIEGLKEGSQIQAESEAGDQLFTVILIEDHEVTLDGNHPLAGQTLNFDLDVKAVRAATAEEIAHRHVHGAGGHHH